MTKRVLKITYVPITELKPSRNNARLHSNAQIEQIVRSIEEFGFTNPILVDHRRNVLAGHGRLEAAKRMGLKKVPAVALSNMTAAQKRAYIIADNKIAANAGWDRELLALEFQDLLELDFDVELTGFDGHEIELLIDGLAVVEDDDALNEIPEIDQTQPPVTQPGDLWEIGLHRLLCGDALERASYRRLLGNRKAQMVFTDPPYNVPIKGHVSGLGKVAHEEFLMASGELSATEFVRFLESGFHHMAAFSRKGALLYICMDWRHSFEILTAAQAAFDEFKNLCVWNKTNGGMGALYRSKHELVFVFKKQGAPHINNIELGKHGRYRTNVWDYAGVNTFREGRMEDLESHPTVKPVALIADAILDCTRKGALVLDPFLGSGSTLVAAEQTGRHGFGMELDPRYCDVILERMCQASDLEPVHAESGRTYAELKDARDPADTTQIKRSGEAG